MKFAYLSAVTAAVAAFSAVAPATAQTAYTDKAAFLAAAGSTQTETFSNAPVGNFSTGATFSAAFDGFNITGTNGGNYVGIATDRVARSGSTLSQNSAIPSAFVGQKFLEWGNIAGGIMSMTINFNAATTAFGFDWFDTDTTDSYSINTPGGTIFNSPPFNFASGGVASTGFFGLVSATPFTSVVITNNATGGYMSDEGMDNFITNGVGSVNSAVPEPATWAMMMLGFGGIGYAMRRKNKVAARIRFA